MTENSAGSPLQTRGQSPEFRTLGDLIRRLESYGSEAAVIALQQEGSASLKRAELLRRIENIAAALHGAGVRADARVVLWAENSPEWIIACLAVIRAGAVAVPLDIQLGRENLARIMKDCTPKYVLTQERHLARLEELGDAVPEVLLLDPGEEQERSLWRLSGEADLPEREEEQQAVIFYTSGTTGPPKGVPLTDRNLVFQINRLIETGLVSREGDRALLPLPLHHVYPFTVGMLFPLSAVIPIILPHALTGPQIVRAMREERASAVVGVPRLHRALFEAISGRFTSRGRFGEYLFKALHGSSCALRRRFGLNAGKSIWRFVHTRIAPELRLLASGGSPLDPQLAEDLEGMGWEVAIGYGLTETSPLLTVNPPGARRFDTVGVPLPGVEIRIDETVGDQEGEGEILARGPNVFSGYRNLPEKTREDLSEDGWFRTGDLGSIDESGFLKVTGRVSTLIITESGENIRPQEVEEAYQKNPAIREIGVLADDGRLVALIVAEDKDSGEEQIKQALAEQAEGLPSYWSLADYALTGSSLPRTRLGKFRRHLLAERYREAKEGGEKKADKPMALSDMSGEDRALLENNAARSTWDWLAQRYRERGLTPDSRLEADLGIDSLEWLTVTVEIGQRTGIELEEEAITELESVRDLLQKVAETDEEGERGFSGEPLENPEEVLSAEQKNWLEPPTGITGALRKPLFDVNRWVMRRLFNLQVEGDENLPEDGNFMLAPNHLSLLDPPALAAVLADRRLEKTWWGGWTGIAFGTPLSRWLSRLGNAVPVDPDRAVISGLAFGAAVLKCERNLVWFPEGQRSPDGELMQFKPGIGLLLQKQPVPVIPVRISGSREALPPGKFWPRFKTIRVVIGAPLDPRKLSAGEQEGEGARRIARALRERIQEM